VLTIPSDEAIRARAHELGLIASPQAPLPNAVRRRVAKLISDEATASEQAPQAPPHQLLSRFTYETPAGLIQVDVLLFPHQKEGPTNG